MRFFDEWLKALNQRLENWKRLRAPGWPDFLRSFMRRSRVSAIHEVAQVMIIAPAPLIQLCNRGGLRSCQRGMSALLRSLKLNFAGFRGKRRQGSRVGQGKPEQEAADHENQRSSRDSQA